MMSLRTENHWWEKSRSKVIQLSIFHKKKKKRKKSLINFQLKTDLVFIKKFEDLSSGLTGAAELKPLQECRVVCGVYLPARPERIMGF
jgi:hypothetical protein